MSRAGLFSSTLSSRYDAHTTDSTWVCVFCKQGPHSVVPGDPSRPHPNLAGPHIAPGTYTVSQISQIHSITVKNIKIRPVRNISHIFLEIFSDFLRNFLRLPQKFLQNFFKYFLRFSVCFGTLMRKWEIFPKHSFSTVFRNCSPILF